MFNIAASSYGLQRRVVMCMLQGCGSEKTCVVCEACFPGPRRYGVRFGAGTTHRRSVWLEALWIRNRHLWNEPGTFASTSEWCGRSIRAGLRGVSIHSPISGRRFCGGGPRLAGSAGTCSGALGFGPRLSLLAPRPPRRHALALPRQRKSFKAWRILPILMYRFSTASRTPASQHRRALLMTTAGC